MNTNTNLIILSNLDKIEEDMSANNDCVNFTIRLKNLLVQSYEGKDFDFSFESEALTLHRTIDFQFEEDRITYNYLSAFCNGDEVALIANPHLYYTGLNEQGILDATWSIRIREVINERLGPLSQGCDIQ